MSDQKPQDGGAADLTTDALKRLAELDQMMADGLLDTVRKLAMRLYGETQVYPCDDVKRMAAELIERREADERPDLCASGQVRALEWEADPDHPDCQTADAYDIWHEGHGYQLYFWSVIHGQPHKSLASAQQPAEDAEPSEWSGSPCPDDPDNYWINDKTGERVSAHPPQPSASVAEAALVDRCQALVAAYDRENPMRTADCHGDECSCMRCHIDALRALKGGA